MPLKPACSKMPEHECLTGCQPTELGQRSTKEPSQAPDLSYEPSCPTQHIPNPARAPPLCLQQTICFYIWSHFSVHLKMPNGVTGGQMRSLSAFRSPLSAFRPGRRAHGAHLRARSDSAGLSSTAAFVSSDCLPLRAVCVNLGGTWLAR